MHFVKVLLPLAGGRKAAHLALTLIFTWTAGQCVPYKPIEEARETA
jgi:hypothetical protein